MIPKKFYIYDSLLSLTMFGLIVYFISDFEIKLISTAALVTYVVSSILINLNKYLYFLSATLIGILTTTMLILMFIPFYKEENIIIWLLYSISWLLVIIAIFTKKAIFESLAKKPFPGEKGILGDKGKVGNSYFLQTYQDKSYNEIILNIEDYLEQNKKDNKIPFEEGEEHMKNMFLKELFRRIVYSQQYGNYLNAVDKTCTYLRDENKRKCIDKSKSNKGNINCNTMNDCSSSTNINVEMRYREITDYLKNITLDYIKIMLRNNCAEEEVLKERNLGTSLELNDGSYNYYRNLNELYNNKSGHKFINDYFLNESFFTKYLVKKNKNIDCDGDNPKYTNPLENIKKIDLSSYDKDFASLENPYFWGIGKCK